MKTVITAFLLLLLSATPSSADIVFGFDPANLTIVEGTASINIIMEITATAGETELDGFQYALAIGDGMGAGEVSGSGNAPTITAAATLNNVVTWNRNLLGPPLGGQAYAEGITPPTAGTTLDLTAGAQQVVQFTLDTSQAIAGDAWDMELNFTDFGEVSLGGLALTPLTSDIFRLTVIATAVPEPSSLSLLLAGCCLATCRRRRR